MKALLWFAISLVLSSVSPALATPPNIITLNLTPTSASDVSATVRIDLSITDTGGVPDCAGMEIRRRAAWPCAGGPNQVVESIPRELGTRTLQFFDVVAPNTSYEYTIVPTGEGCDPFYFFVEFSPYNGWPEQITAYTSVGPDPTPLAHGRLISTEDAAAPVYLQNCTDSCLFAHVYGGPPEVRQYVDTDTVVLLFGSVHWVDNSVGWAFFATSAVPQPCPPLAVESRTWSNLKLLYR